MSEPYANHRPDSGSTRQTAPTRGLIAFFMGKRKEPGQGPMTALNLNTCRPVSVRQPKEFRILQTDIYRQYTSVGMFVNNTGLKAVNM